MSNWRAFGLGMFAAVCLLGESAGLAHAQCVLSEVICAAEWSGGAPINLGALPGSSGSAALSINDAGQVVGYSFDGTIVSLHATEWIDGTATALVGLPGSTSSWAQGINNSGHVVGFSQYSTGPITEDATEWIGGRAIDLGGLPGSTFSQALSMNDRGQAVGSSTVGGNSYATEWSGRSVIDLGGLPGSTRSFALSINNAGHAVGYSIVGGIEHATEWNGGHAINLPCLPGATEGCYAFSINDSGQVVGETNDYAPFLRGVEATEWSGGDVIALGGLPEYTYSEALGINDLGQVVGVSAGRFVPSGTVPEPSTWAMMLLGSAGLALAGHRRAKAGPATGNRLAHMVGG
jgi:probable HAF family extracellular repeat protein